MALTQTQTVSGLTILNNSDNVVAIVEVKTVSIDDSNPDKLTIERTESYDIDSSGGKDAAGFVAYESLTQDIILGWISTELSAADTLGRQARWIESKKNPPTPARVKKPIPF